ncbi:MAG: DUF2061 domain-containing protein [Gemmatimonadota bacterium]
MVETRIRTAAKAGSYRLLALLATVAVVFAATGRAMLSLGVGLGELVAKLSLYYVHERLWSRVRWGVTWRDRGGEPEEPAGRGPWPTSR